MTVRYAHTNLVANDWRALAQFYQQVFHCAPVSTERNHQGEPFQALTAIPNARARGCHLLLPGHGELGPTLEIFQFDPQPPESGKALNQPGFAHIAFEVDDVEAKRAEVLARGGQDLGELVDLEIPGAGGLRLMYMRDPEGNLIELQRWSRDNTEQARPRSLQGHST